MQEKQTLEELAQDKRTSIVSEFIDFLRHNKKWWLLPVVIMLLLMGVLVLLSSSAIAPFIYPLF